MSSKMKRMVFSQFAFWVVVVILIKYFLFSFNLDVLREDVPGRTFTQKLFRAVKVPRIKLGIDLQGGAHLVVSVALEEAINNRLLAESKMIEQLLKEKELKLPDKKQVKEQNFAMGFDEDSEASAAYSLLKAEMPHLVFKREGTTINVSVPPQDAQQIKLQAMDQAVSVLKRRLDTAGVQGLVVQQHGERQIVVQLPGETDVDEKKELIKQTAHLEFKMVEKEGVTQESLLDEYDGELPPDKMIVPGRRTAGVQRYYLVSTFPDVTGDHITFAKEDFDQYGKLIVRFRLDSVGTREFAELTANNVGGNLGIVIDGVMYSSPGIQSAIPNGEAYITGNYTSESARALAIVLNSGSLDAPIKFEYETRVGASLGWDSIKKGVTSCIVGLCLLFLFGVLYYKLAGFFAFLALLFNLLLVMFFLSWFKFALTLPGIAGMVLTIGMAIDAAILIYERIREEVAGGTTLRKAVQDGFKGATVVILDANITTFLTGLVLFKFGGPSIQGFAVTLMAGIVATILASVFFLKSLFLFMIDTFNVKRFGI